MPFFINTCGLIVNIILDPIFIFGLNMGMVGAGLATIIGQIFGASLALRYLFKYKTGKIERNIEIAKNMINKNIDINVIPMTKKKNALKNWKQK